MRASRLGSYTDQRLSDARASRRGSPTDSSSRRPPTADQHAGAKHGRHPVCATQGSPHPLSPSQSCTGSLGWMLEQVSWRQGSRLSHIDVFHPLDQMEIARLVPSMLADEQAACRQLASLQFAWLLHAASRTLASGRPPSGITLISPAIMVDCATPRTRRWPCTEGGSDVIPHTPS